MSVSKGVYSLYNGWLQKPDKQDIPESPDISAEYNELANKANTCDTVEEIDNFLDDLYKLRQTGLLQDGEFGKGNLVFKELRNNGILQNLKDKKVELENKEMSLGESAKNLNLEEASEEDIKAKALADYSDDSVEAIEDEGDNYYSLPAGEEYLVLTEDEAYEAAKEDIVDIFNDLGLEAFTPDFREYILTNRLDAQAIQDFIDEEIDYYKNQEQDEDMVEYLSDFGTYDAINYLKELFGEEEFSKWVIDNNIINIDAVAEDAIAEDGVAHFIARYDGEELDLGNGLYAYRVN